MYLVNNRVYRKAMPVSEAIEEILRNSATQFDPVVVEKFMDAVVKFGIK